MSGVIFAIEHRDNCSLFIWPSNEKLMNRVVSVSFDDLLPSLNYLWKDTIPTNLLRVINAKTDRRIFQFKFLGISGN